MYLSVSRAYSLELVGLATLLFAWTMNPDTKRRLADEVTCFAKDSVIIQFSL
jgi:hypothetical protein